MEKIYEVLCVMNESNNKKSLNQAIENNRYLNYAIEKENGDLNIDDNYIDIFNDIFKNDNLNYDLNDKKILNLIGLYYQCKINDFDKMKKYYLLAIKLNCIESMCNLAYYYYLEYEYYNKNEYDNIKKYYLMAIGLNSCKAMIEFALYCIQDKKYDEAKKYLLMAIEFNNTKAMIELGIYYKDIEKNYDEMKKYYLMAIELNNTNAMHELADYYKCIIRLKFDELQNYDVFFTKYYNKKDFAIVKLRKNNVMIDNCFCEIEQNYNEMIKYYLMSIELNNEEALFKLFQYHTKLGCCSYHSDEVMEAENYNFNFLYNIVPLHYLLKKINSTIAIKRTKLIENRNFTGVKIFQDLTEYVFNPKRLSRICNIYNIDVADYLEMI